MDDRIKKLRTEVDELLGWKRANELQQVQDPMGVNTTAIVQRDLPIITGESVSGFGTVFDVSLEVSFDGDVVLIPARAV